MTRTAYLEAATRTQDVLSAKWLLRSSGYVVASTWHDEPVLAASGPQSHWSWERLEEMKVCDTLVVVRGQETHLPLELAFTVGLAAARKLNVIWVGEPTDLPVPSRTIRFFATLDDFRKEVLLASGAAQKQYSDQLLAA